MALPLLALGKATWRERDGRQAVVLEFAALVVTLEGEGLRELFDHLLAGRVRVIRRGRSPRSAVVCIHVLDS